MALFKILKGQSANLGNQDLHEGGPISPKILVNFI